jgi:hypothetical protein
MFPGARALVLRRAMGTAPRRTDEPIKFSLSPAASSSPRISLGAGQENPAGPFVYGVMASGVLLTGAILYSCLTGVVDMDPPAIPEVMRKITPAPPSAASASDDQAKR